MVLRLGIAGLGAATRQVLPALERMRDTIQLTAVADIRPEALESFSRDYGIKTFDRVEALAESPLVDAVWVATPNPLHAEHTICLAEHGKHVICEKPMATSLAEAEAMIHAVERNGVRYVQGHSKLFDAPIRKMGEILASGDIGQVFQVNSWRYSDWLMRPRLASEVDTSQGGGIVYRQGPHQIDIVRYLCGGLATWVDATAGRQDPHFDTEGDYSAFIRFADGEVANVAMNGYGFFDDTELTWNIGEGGRVVEPGARGRIRRQGPVGLEEKYRWTEEGHAGGEDNRRRRAPFFGLTVVSGDRGVIRQSPDGIFVYTAAGVREVPCDLSMGRGAELLELQTALSEDRAPFPDARWGMATLEVVLAILDASRANHPVQVNRQVPTPR